MKLVKSLLDQEDPNWRVIFVDYKSEKFHNDYLKDICEQDKRFKIKKQIYKTQAKTINSNYLNTIYFTLLYFT